VSPLNFVLQFPINSTENILRALKELKKLPDNLEVDFKDQAPEESLLKFNESIESIKSIVSDRFPSINPNEFIDFLISSSIKSNNLDFNELIETFKSLNLLDESPEYKEGYSEIIATITVVDPSASTKVNKRSFFDIFNTAIFPIAVFLLTQYQTTQTTDQLNRMEHLLEQHIQQHNELQKVDDNPYIIEIRNDISPGTRT